jgi:hypothetical protein
MIRLVSLILVTLFTLGNTVYGEIKIFLRPKVNLVNNLSLSDMAFIETDKNNIESLKKITIGSELYSDGYVDKKELSLLLKQYTDENIIIYGNAVRTFSTGQESDQSNIMDQDHIGGVVLRKGDTVDVEVKKNGISIILKGTAIDEGRINDEIAVRINYKSGSLSKSAKGRVKAKDLVEINI